MRTRALAATIAAGLTFAGVGAQAQATGDAAELAPLRTQPAALQAKVSELEQKQQAQAAAAASASPLATWADSTKISGTSFIDFTHIAQTSGDGKTAKSGTGLDVKRLYLSIAHQFNDTWSANLTTDFNYTGVAGETRFFVKKLYLQGTFDRLAVFRAGSANMPWIPFVEDWYGYRFVENTLVDRLHFGNSADWGLHLLGDSGTFNYQVSVVNGGGYKHPDRSHGVDVAARVGIQPVKGLMFAVGSYSGDLGEDVATRPALHTAHRHDVLAAWNRAGLRLGVEWFEARDWNQVSTPATDSASGWSAWGSYDFGPATVFARYDRARPSGHLDPGLEDIYWNAGVAFPITHGIKVALAYKDEHLGDHAMVNVGTREIGAWGEFKF